MAKTKPLFVDPGIDFSLRFGAALEAKLARKEPLEAATSMRLTKEVLRMIDEVAEQKGRSRNQVLLALLQLAVDLYESRGLERPAFGPPEPPGSTGFRGMTPEQNRLSERYNAALAAGKKKQAEKIASDYHAKYGDQAKRKRK